MARRNHGSKWTAEFLVASELSRRGYTVAFTQGSHTPDYDLLVGTTTGVTFAVDVKGMASRGAWLVKNKVPRPGLFYILAMVPPGGAGRRPDEIFILTQEEVRLINKRYRDEHPNQSDHGIEGFNYRDVLPHRDAWSKLPSADR
jgi:hypothetical protein